MCCVQERGTPRAEEKKGDERNRKKAKPERVKKDKGPSLTPSGKTPDSIFRPDVSFFAVDPFDRNKFAYHIICRIHM